MDSAGSPFHTPSDVFQCYNNMQCSRADTPPGAPLVRPIIPGCGYWIPEEPPVPVEYRSVFVKPPPTPPGPRWYPSPIFQYGYSTPRMLPPPPLFYRSCVSNQSYSPDPCFQRVNRDDIVEKQPFQTTPTSDSEGLSTSYTLNPSESPIKYKPSTKTSWGESSVTPKHKKNNRKVKPTQKNVIENLEVEVKEGNGDFKYRYNKSIKEIHPEVMAKWRQNLNKPQESLSTHKVKIEICLKDKDSICVETTTPTVNKECGRKHQEASNMKIKLSSKDKGKRSPKSRQLNTKLQMASSNSPGKEKCSGKDGLTPDSPTRDRMHSSSDNKRSALRFTPPQVHKNTKDSSHKNVLKRKSYDIEEGLVTVKNGKSPTKNSSNNSYRDRTSESFKRSSFSKVESWKSPRDKSDQDLDRCLEKHRSRDERNLSPARTNEKNSVSSRKSSSNILESHSSVKYGSDSDSDCDEGQNSSVYVTPEGTPISKKFKESEERQHSRFKRTLSDEHHDESHLTNSSFNTSDCYYTPESSPQKFNPAKRPKTRWSDSSPFSLNNSSYTSWRDRLSDSSEKGLQPELIGYQMVGDSQFCRFGQQLLGLERVPTPNSSGRIGICVSGQTITDLHRRVKENFYPISDKIILMIGTNDFLRNVNVTTMCEELSSLVKTLQKSASTIILLTLPPIPKLEKKNSAIHFKLLDMYNDHIRSLENGETVRIADISPLYLTPPPYQRCKMHLFEVFFNGPARRLDLIHLNRSGLEIVRKYILDKFL